VRLASRGRGNTVVGPPGATSTWAAAAVDLDGLSHRDRLDCARRRPRAGSRSRVSASRHRRGRTQPELRDGQVTDDAIAFRPRARARAKPTPPHARGQRRCPDEPPSNSSAALKAPPSAANYGDLERLSSQGARSSDKRRCYGR
jgi:hypothetical protein